MAVNKIDAQQRLCLKTNIAFANSKEILGGAHWSITKQRMFCRQKYWKFCKIILMENICTFRENQKIESFGGNRQTVKKCFLSATFRFIKTIKMECHLLNQQINIFSLKKVSRELSGRKSRNNFRCAIFMWHTFFLKGFRGRPIML